MDQWHDATLPSPYTFWYKTPTWKLSAQRLCDRQLNTLYEQNCSSTGNIYALNSCTHLYHTFLSSLSLSLRDLFWTLDPTEQVSVTLIYATWSWHARCNRHWMMTETKPLNALQIRNINSCFGKYWHALYLLNLLWCLQCVECLSKDKMILIIF